MIPTLTTQRLRLVPPTEAHLPGETAFWASDRSSFVGGPVAADKVWRILALHRGHWDLRGYGSWAIEEIATGAHVGQAGIWHPGEWPEPELGYHLFEGFEGKGYVTEAGRAVIDHAYGTLGFTTLTSFIAPANTASAAVAQRLGAVKTDATFQIDPAKEPVEIWRYPGPQGHSTGGRQ